MARVRAKSKSREVQKLAFRFHRAIILALVEASPFGAGVLALPRPPPRARRILVGSSIVMGF